MKANWIKRTTAEEITKATIVLISNYTTIQDAMDDSEKFAGQLEKSGSSVTIEERCFNSQLVGFSVRGEKKLYRDTQESHRRMYLSPIGDACGFQY